MDKTLHSWFDCPNKKHKYTIAICEENNKMYLHSATAHMQGPVAWEDTRILRQDCKQVMDEIVHLAQRIAALEKVAEVAASSKTIKNHALIQALKEVGYLK